MNTNSIETKQGINYVAGRIYSTTNYGMFGGIIGNRKVSERHVAMVMKSIMRKNLLASNPIEVTKDFRIIDGQHRLEAAKSLQTPIYFTISTANSLEDIQLLNTHTKIWSSLDYLESYIELGNKKYVEFKDFIKEYSLSVNAGLALIKNDDSGTYNIFKRGEFTFSEEELEEAKHVASLMFELRPYFLDQSYKSAKIAYTLKGIISKHLADKLVTKTKQASPKYRHQQSVRDYLRMFEDVLNWNQKTDIVRLY